MRRTLCCPLFPTRDVDLVIVTTANTEESIFELIEKYVLPSVQKSR
jgi:hypothetical protein